MTPKLRKHVEDMGTWLTVNWDSVLKCRLCKEEEILFKSDSRQGIKGLECQLYNHRDKFHPDVFIGDMWEMITI